MAESVFSGRPGLSHFGREQQRQQNNKSFVPTSPGVARDSFFLFFYLFIFHLIYLINLISSIH